MKAHFPQPDHAAQVGGQAPFSGGLGEPQKASRAAALSAVLASSWANCLEPQRPNKAVVAKSSPWGLGPEEAWTILLNSELLGKAWPPPPHPPAQRPTHPSLAGAEP